jgi:hypothetical protein
MLTLLLSFWGDERIDCSDCVSMMTYHCRYSVTIPICRFGPISFAAFLASFLVTLVGPFLGVFFPGLLGFMRFWSRYGPSVLGRRVAACNESSSQSNVTILTVPSILAFRTVNISLASQAHHVSEGTITTYPKVHCLCRLSLSR